MDADGVTATTAAHPSGQRAPRAARVTQVRQGSKMRGVETWPSVGAILVLALLLAACQGTEAGPAPPTPTLFPAPAVAPPPTSQATPEPKVEAGAAVGELTTAPQPQEAQVTKVGQRDARAVALTFDTGVAAGHTREIPGTLRGDGIRGPL